MSWTTTSFRPWDPAWISLDAGKAATLTTQKDADPLFTRLGYADGTDFSWRGGEPPSHRPVVSAPKDMQDKIETFRNNIKRSWQHLHDLLSKEELPIQARFYQLTPEERDDVFSRAWAAAARQDTISQHSFADARWLRDHFQGVYSKPKDQDGDVMDIDEDGDVPDSWPGWLSLEKLPAEADPSPLVFLVPQINLENLRIDPIFQTFLHWRGREPPSAFWRQDWHHCYIGTALRCQKNEFVAGHTMAFIEDGVPIQDYGRLSNLSAAAEASAGEGNSLVTGEGFNVLRAQAMIYAFLYESCRLIKKTVVPGPDNRAAAAAAWSEFARKYEHAGDIREKAESNVTSLQDTHEFLEGGLNAVVLAHYDRPAAPDFAALVESLNEAVQRSADHLQKMRRHPLYWRAQLHAGQEHFWGNIPNAGLQPLSADVKYSHSGHGGGSSSSSSSSSSGQTPSKFESQVRAGVVKEVIIRAVEMHLYWLSLRDRMSKIAELVGGDDVYRSERVHHELGGLYVGLRQAFQAVRGHFVRHVFEASPNLRHLFRRHTGAAIVGPSGLDNDRLLRQTAVRCVADWPSPLHPDFDLAQHAVVLLNRVVQLLSQDLPLDHVGAGNLADMLSEFTDANTEIHGFVKAHVSAHIWSLLTDLCALGHLLRQVECVRSYSHVLNRDAALARGLVKSEPGFSMGLLRRDLAIQPHDCDPWFAGDMNAPLYEDLAEDHSAANHRRTVQAEQRLQGFWRWADRQIDDICRHALSPKKKSTGTGTGTGPGGGSFSISLGTALPRTAAAVSYRNAVAEMDRITEAEEPWTNVSYENWKVDALEPPPPLVEYHDNAIKVDRQDYDVVKHIFLLKGHTRKEIPWQRFLRFMCGTVGFHMKPSFGNDRKFHWTPRVTITDCKIVTRFEEPHSPINLQFYVYSKFHKNQFRVLGIDAGHFIPPE